jgi:hypothetical protein
MAYLVLALRFLIGATFLVASASKISSKKTFREFAGYLNTLQIIPSSRVKPTAAVLVTVEICICGLLATPYQRSGIVGFCLAAGLLSAFAGGLTVSMRKGVQAACRCFGPATSTVGWRHLGRNVLLAVGAVAGVIVAAEEAPIRCIREALSSQPEPACFWLR